LIAVFAFQSPFLRELSLSGLFVGALNLFGRKHGSVLEAGPRLRHQLACDLRQQVVAGLLFAQRGKDSRDISTPDLSGERARCPVSRIS
jgi:hypothetical protein